PRERSAWSPIRRRSGISRRAVAAGDPGILLACSRSSVPLERHWPKWRWQESEGFARFVPEDLRYRFLSRRNDGFPDLCGWQASAAEARLAREGFKWTRGTVRPRHETPSHARGTAQGQRHTRAHS